MQGNIRLLKKNILCVLDIVCMCDKERGGVMLQGAGGNYMISEAKPMMDQIHNSCY